MENGEPKTIKGRIEKLHENIKKVDLKKVRDKLEKEGSAQGEHLKTEINAITSYFIEKIWLKIAEDLKKGDLGLATREEEIGSTALSEESIRKFSNIKLVRPEDVLHLLKYGSLNFLGEKVLEWQAIREEEAVNNPDDKENKIYQRFKSILPVSGDQQENPADRINSGMYTAEVTIWETLGLLAKVYQQQFKQPLPQDKFKELAKNALPLIYQLAGSHLDVFATLRDKFQWDVEVSNESLEGFYSDQFYFREESGALKLELKESVIDSAEVISGGDPRTGCPAIYAMGPHGKNVIFEMFEWILELAEKYYVPVLKREGKII